MGWNSAGAIFDPVAQALMDLDATNEMKIKVLGPLISTLQDGDWDRRAVEFQDDPAIVEAFRQHGIIITCSDESDSGYWCELERGHEGDHEDNLNHSWPRKVKL